MEKNDENKDVTYGTSMHNIQDNCKSWCPIIVLTDTGTLLCYFTTCILNRRLNSTKTSSMLMTRKTIDAKHQRAPFNIVNLLDQSFCAHCVVI